MKKLLVIEDDVDTLERVAMSFQDLGFEVIPSTRKLTVQKIWDIHPDIIIWIITSETD